MKHFNYITEPHTFIHIIPRMCSTIIVRGLSKTQITPNQITIFRAIFNLLALVFFAIGNYLCLVLAFFTFQINEILDHVDGDLARIKNLRSKKGLFLEHLIDVPGSSMYGFFGLCVSIGIYRETRVFNIFYIFIAILIGAAMNEAFSEAFGLKENKASFEHAEYEGYASHGQNRGCMERLRITLRDVFIWKNQAVLWGALLCRPIETFLHFNPVFWAMVWIALIYQLLWLRTVYLGYKNVITKQQENS